jgi:hypothetical protein
LAGCIESNPRVMLVQPGLGDFASSIISSKNSSRRGYADQTGTEVPISATLVLPILLSLPRPIEMRDDFRARARETRDRESNRGARRKSTLAYSASTDCRHANRADANAMPAKLADASIVLGVRRLTR